MSHDFMKDPEFLELFPELKEQSVYSQLTKKPKVKKAPKKAPAKPQDSWQNQPEDPHTQQAMKTIQWKFKDPLSEFPEIAHLKDVEFTGPQAIFDNFKFLIDHTTVEHFIVFWLSCRNRVIGYEIVCRGTLDMSFGHPREIFRGAIVASCAGIVVAHNHPSGQARPSEQDKVATKELVKAGNILSIPIVDSMIMTDTEYFSFALHGLLE